MTDPERREWALSRIEGRVEADPDGKQNEQSNVWTSEQRLKGDASKTDLLERDDVGGLVRDLANAGDVITWHGLVAPATEEHLEAIIGCENRSDAPRRLLIERCKRVINGGPVYVE